MNKTLEDLLIKLDRNRENKEELYKKLSNIFGEGCLSEDAHKCEYNGICILHEKVKALEAIEEYSKQLIVDTIVEFAKRVEKTDINASNYPMNQVISVKMQMLKELK